MKISFLLIILVFILIKMLMNQKARTHYGGSSQIKFNFVSTEFNKVANELFNKLRNTIDNPVIETVDDIKYSLTYLNKGNNKIGNHNGQRKLGLSEIQFLTEYYKTADPDQKVFCVYAGAAPGNKTHMLTKMFPSVYFILVDPNKFEIMIEDPKKKDSITSHRNIIDSDIIHMNWGYPTKSKKWKPENKNINNYDENDISEVADFIKNDTENRIFIFENFFDESGEIFNGILSKIGAPILFVSDIRSKIDSKGYPEDVDIIWNTAMMYNWIKLIRPEYSMIKFRLPFIIDDTSMENKSSEFATTFDLSKKNGIDFVGDNKLLKFKMMSGKLFIQVWPPKSSTELRLHTSKNEIDTIVDYNIQKIESKLNYYNLIDRTLLCHQNSNCDKQLGFCLCNDCSLENKIWSDYIQISNSDKSVKYFIKCMDKIVSRPLAVTHKFQIYKPKSTHEIIKSFESGNYRKSNIKNQKGNAGRIKK